MFVFSAKLPCVNKNQVKPGSISVNKCFDFFLSYVYSNSTAVETDSLYITAFLVTLVLAQLTLVNVCFHFSVQAEVIPAVLQSASNGYLMGQGGYRPKDICVSAPTGSGKTLSFVIPVVQVSEISVGKMLGWVLFK